MAVYTEVSEEELRAFVAQYEIGDLTSYKGIAEGVENSNFVLQTTQAKFILTLYEGRVDVADLPYFITLMEHLAAAQVKVPAVVKTKTGWALGRLAGKPAAIVTFLEGMWPRKPQVQHVAEVGRTLAQMHQSLSDFPLKRANQLSIQAWRPMLESLGDQVDTMEAGLSDELRASLERLEAGWPAKLPRGTIHADLFPDNVFFLDNQLSGLIDFYFACSDLLLYDLGVCHNAWCFEPSGELDVAKSTALLEAYHAVRPLEPREWEALPLVCEGASIRFLLTRLTDWLRRKPGAMVVAKDPFEFLARFRFHRSVNSAADYGFLL